MSEKKTAIITVPRENRSGLSTLPNEVQRSRKLTNIPKQILPASANVALVRRRPSATPRHAAKIVDTARMRFGRIDL